MIIATEDRHRAVAGTSAEQVIGGEAIEVNDTIADRRLGCSEVGEGAVSLWWSIAWVFQIWLVSSARWVLSDSVVPWDSKNQFFAFFRFLAESLHAGTSVFWNPYRYGGHPSIADPQSLIFSPPFLLWAWLDRTPSMHAFDLIVYAHLLIGGVSICILGRRRGWPVEASVVAAAVFMLGGSASARLNHTGIITCYGFFPLAVVLLESFLCSRRIAAAAGFAVTASMILLARNQVALMLCMVLIAYMLREVVRSGQPLEFIRVRASGFLVAGILILSITFVPLLLTLQLAALSNRPAVELADALQASLYPANLASLAVPNIFGSHAPGFGYWGPSYLNLPDVRATDDSFNYLFIGAVPTLLLAWIGLAGGRLADRRYRSLSLLLAAATLFAIGRYTPLYALVFEHVPGFTFFRRPIDATFVMLFALAMIVGHLVADLSRNDLPRLRPLPLAIVLASGVAITASAISISALSGHGEDAFYSIAAAGGPGLLLLLGLRRVEAPARRAFAVHGIAALAVLELLVWNAASRLNAEHRHHYDLLEEDGAEDTPALRLLVDELNKRHLEGARPRVEIVGLHGPWQNLSMVYKLEATNGYNPLRIGVYDRFVSPGESSWVAKSRRFPASFSGYDCDLARALGLEYLVLDRPLEDFGRVPGRRRYEALMSGPNVWIYRLSDAMPRVVFTSRVDVADVDATTSSGALQYPPEADHVVIDDETPPASGLLWMQAASDGSRASITSWRPGRLEIAVEASRSGVVVLHDTYYPGWQAELDGRPVPIMRASVFFRAVEIPAGKHVVTMRFEPLTLENIGNAIATVAGRKRRAISDDD